MPWNYRQFGKAARPIHKSDLVEMTGEFGCPRRFKYAQDAIADGLERDRSEVVSPKTVFGSAVHETMARALSNDAVVADILAGECLQESRVRATLEHELKLAADGRRIDWGRNDPSEMIADYTAMTLGALHSLCGRVARIVMVEAGFTVELDGMVFAGHTDLVYEPIEAPGELGLLDWKTGDSKPDEIELDHGWEAGIYSLALKRGTFLPRDRVLLGPAAQGGWIGQYRDGDQHGAMVTRATRWQAERDGLEAALERVAAGEHFPSELRFERFPERIHLVHMASFVPYEKAGTKEVKRAEDVEYYQVPSGTKVKFKPGDLRGPGWLPIRRKENDLPRLAHRLRTVVGTVRMGRFLDLVGERCKRCPYKGDCLNGGYQLRGEEAAELERTLREAGL